MDLGVRSYQPRALSTHVKSYSNITCSIVGLSSSPLLNMVEVTKAASTFQLCLSLTPGISGCFEYLVYSAMYICKYMHVCMYMYMYAFIYMCICMCISLGISASACGQCHACACIFVCICMRMHMYVKIYICAFFCIECCMHFGTGVLCTSACAGVYVQQAFLQHRRTHLRHTRCRVCIYVCAYICVYECICIWLRMCVYDIA